LSGEKGTERAATDVRMDTQRNWNTFVSAASMPPIDTERWKYPAGACGRALAHVSTDERVRSHVSGVTLDTVPCLINVGTATQSFVITSGSDTWWRSTDCQSESSDQVVQLAPGQTVSSVTPLTWDRTRSSVDTCASRS
jgi:hypothetical protein